MWRTSPNLTLYELIPGFSAGLLTTIIVSLLTKPPEDVDTMFAAMTDGPNA